MLYAGTKINKYDVTDIVDLATYCNAQDHPTWYAMAGGCKKIAELNNLTSADLDTQVKYTLDHMTMFTNKHVPHNWRDVDDTEWAMAYRFGISTLYKYAKEHNYALSKWNSTLAWQELKYAIEHLSPKLTYGLVPLCINLDTNGWRYDNARFYDEHDEWIEFFISMYEVDRDNNLGALAYARDSIWDFINNHHWSGDHYWYAAGWHDFECEGAFFHMIFCRLMALNGYGLANWDRVLTDMKTRYLNSLWSSPQWSVLGTPQYAVVHHNPDNNQVRLENTIGAWFSLQAFYQILDAQSKANIVSMLDGTVKAWEHLINSSGLYDAGTHKFRLVNAGDYLDSCTAYGIYGLFLLGIIPQTGSLYSPIHEWRYECWENADEYFNFDYTNRVVRIPVLAGTIKFIYGSTPVTKTFTEDGVYEVTFDSNWNSATINKVGTLNPLKTYVRQIGAPIVQKETTTTLQLVKD
jgi:hypothetical protein